MCKRCHEKNLQAQRTRALVQKRNKISLELTELLYRDAIKGSEYKRLMDMNNSPDLENLVLVEEIIKFNTEAVWG